MINDYYSTLGVNRNAGEEEIKKAYRRLVKQYHPDINRSQEAEDKMKDINNAYEHLMKSKPNFENILFEGFPFGRGFVEVNFKQNIYSSVLTINFLNSLNDEDISKILNAINDLGFKEIGYSYSCKSGAR